MHEVTILVTIFLELHILAIRIPSVLTFAWAHLYEKRASPGSETRIRDHFAISCNASIRMILFIVIMIIEVDSSQESSRMLANDLQPLPQRRAVLSLLNVVIDFIRTDTAAVGRDAEGVAREVDWTCFVANLTTSLQETW